MTPTMTLPKAVGGENSTFELKFPTLDWNPPEVPLKIVKRNSGRQRVPFDPSTRNDPKKTDPTRPHYATVTSTIKPVRARPTFKKFMEGITLLQQPTTNWYLDDHELSAALRPFEEEIRESLSRIYASSADSDDALYDHATWERTIELVNEGASHIDAAFPNCLRFLEISPTDDASVDVVLSVGTRRMALNVGADGEEVRFFMTSVDPDVRTQRGKVSPNENGAWLFGWLIAQP